MKIDGPGPIPADALQYFRAKANRYGFDYRDVWRSEHASAFTVAKAMQAAVLAQIRQALDDALAQGTTMRQFAQRITPVLQELGWWGKAAVTDPATGEKVDAQLGSPRRLKTIYRANMRTARAAGQWQRAERTKQDLPYLIYELGPSREHRDEHVAWHGTVLPVDDPWWGTHMPPNGWGCKCRVRQISRVEFARMAASGVPGPVRTQETDPETGLLTGHVRREKIAVKTQAPPVRQVPWQNKRTGQVEMVPEGIDPGWDTNPGKSRVVNLRKFLDGKLAELPAEAAAAARSDMEFYDDARQD
jgi:SPP1 gp7 family putative phage head morphogenesis protein